MAIEFERGQRYSASAGTPSFKALRILSIVITVIAILTGLGFAFACYSLFTSTMLAFYGSAGFIAVALTALFGAVLVIFLLALAESIKLLLAIENNTRLTGEYLKRQTFQKQEVQ